MLLIQRPKKSLCEVPAGRPKGIPNYRRYRALNAPTPRIRQSDLKIVILCLLGAGFSVALMIALTHNRVDGTDFLSFYAGGRLAATGHLYDTQAIWKAQFEATGRYGPGLLFIRLPCF